MPDVLAERVRGGADKDYSDYGTLPDGALGGGWLSPTLDGGAALGASAGGFVSDVLLYLA